MHLNAKEAQLFFRLMNALQFYANQELNIQPDVKSLDDYVQLSAEEKIEIRDKLYEDPSLFDSFVAQNSTTFSDDELAVVRSWKNFVKGDFFVERHLKKHSIWIGDGSSPKVYAVIGLTESLSDVIHKSYLPFRVNGVLLPFHDRIIYDGLLRSYRIFFGSGIKADLRETYMAAKQNRRIIETLDPAVEAKQEAAAASKSTRDWRPEVDEMVKQASKLKGQKVPIQTEAFSLLKASANLTQTVVSTSTDTGIPDLDELWQQHKKVRRALNKLETALYRAEM